MLVIDWVMRKTLRGGNTGIRWRFNKKLDDLDFTDDLALLSSTRRQLQLKNERLRTFAPKSSHAQIFLKL